MLNIADGSDLPQVVALINASYRGEAARQGWTHEADYIDGERTTVEALRSDLTANPNARCYFLQDKLAGQLLGCVWLEPHQENVWYLGLLTVRPDLQARQLGRQILVEAEALAQSKGASVIRITVVHLRDTLIAYYERRGYELIGEMMPFPCGDPPRDDLHFVVLEKRL